MGTVQSLVLVLLGWVGLVCNCAADGSKVAFVSLETNHKKKTTFLQSPVGRRSYIQRGLNRRLLLLAWIYM